MQNDWALLADNVIANNQWGGPISTYRVAPEGTPNAGQVGWSPLAAQTYQSNAVQAHGTETFLRLTGDQTLPAMCERLKDLYVPFEGDFGTETYVRHQWILTHQFPSFVFPADASQIPTADTPIAAIPESKFSIQLQKPVRRTDGTYDYTTVEILETRTWKLDEVLCEQPFTVEPVWSSEPSGAPFVRQNASGETEYLSYRVRYSADRCRFTIRNQSFSLSDGTKLSASLGGYFAKPDDGKGYKVVFTNVEF